MTTKKQGKGKLIPGLLIVLAMLAMSAYAGHQFHKKYKGIEIHSLQGCLEKNPPEKCVSTGNKWFE